MKSNNYIKMKWLIISLALVYVLSCIYLSGILYVRVLESNHDYGVNTEEDSRISDVDYAKLCFRYPPDDELSGDNYSEKKIIFFPLTIHWFWGAKSIYWYTYRVFHSENEEVAGSYDIPVTVTWNMMKHHWRITNVYEAP